MVDSIQSTSSIPLPTYQTALETKNPLPLNSPVDTKKVDDKSAEQKATAQSDRFEDYLNQTSLTTLEKSEPKKGFDPAAEIVSGSVYGQPGTGAVV